MLVDGLIVICFALPSVSTFVRVLRLSTGYSKCFLGDPIECSRCPDSFSLCHLVSEGHELLSVAAEGRQQSRYGPKRTGYKLRLDPNH